MFTQIRTRLNLPSQKYKERRNQRASLRAAQRRVLTPAETALFPKDFTRHFDIESVVLINRAHNLFTRRKILVRGQKIYWPNAPKDFTQMSKAHQAILLHELCHVWQYSTGRLTALRYFCNPRNWIYKYTLSDHLGFTDYPIEKQADLMQDWYRLNCGITAACCAPSQNLPTCMDLNRIIPFQWHDNRPV